MMKEIIDNTLAELDTNNLAVAQAQHFINNPDLTIEGVGRLNGRTWALIVSERPELARYCPFGYFDATDWITVLTACPDLAKDVMVMEMTTNYLVSQQQAPRISSKDVLIPYGRLAYVLAEDGQSAVVVGIADYPCHTDVLIVPSEIEGYKVRSIRSLQCLCTHCSDCHELNCLEIEDGVLEIEDYAFRGMAVSKLILPASVSKISGVAFEEMNKCGEVIHEGCIMKRNGK